VRWENLVVSENSMGFHNPSEVSTELHNALSFAQSAKQKAEDALAEPCVPTEPTEVTCDDGLDNDCDGKIDGEDPDCPVVQCEELNQEQCDANPDCRWNKKKGCLPR
jgi:hypothetical protein